MRRAVSRRTRADEKNPALSVDRKLFGTSTIGSHPARSAPAVASRDPPRSAVACRSAIGRPILYRCGRYVNSGGGECHHNTGDGDAMLRLVLDALVKCVSKAGGPLPTVGRVFFPQITEQSECRGDSQRHFLYDSAL